ncbi:MAG TPA: hypothetical protein VH140_08400 [Candidatus Acidoferrum sp.]|nr:hypothetical protein [Candidatus Acidoferrum sp.]
MAQILEREQGSLIHDWFTLVEKQEDLTAIPLTYEERSGHLPQLLADVIARLDFPVEALLFRRPPVATAICDANRATLRPCSWRSREFWRFACSPLYIKTTLGWTTITYYPT